MLESHANINCARFSTITLTNVGFIIYNYQSNPSREDHIEVKFKAFHRHISNGPKSKQFLSQQLPSLQLFRVEGCDPKHFKNSSIIFSYPSSTNASSKKIKIVAKPLRLQHRSMFAPMHDL